MNVFSNNVLYTTIKVRQIKILQEMTAYQKHEINVCFVISFSGENKMDKSIFLAIC